MATATRIALPPPPPPPEEFIILNLSLDEATTLAYICGLISGCPRKSRRKHTDSISDALEQAGIYAQSVCGLISGDIRCDEEVD